jgi:hypothetical protein
VQRSPGKQALKLARRICIRADPVQDAQCGVDDILLKPGAKILGDSSRDFRGLASLESTCDGYRYRSQRPSPA